MGGEAAGGETTIRVIAVVRDKCPVKLAAISQGEPSDIRLLLTSFFGRGEGGDASRLLADFRHYLDVIGSSSRLFIRGFVHGFHAIAPHTDRVQCFLFLFDLERCDGEVLRRGAPCVSNTHRSWAQRENFTRVIVWCWTAIDTTEAYYTEQGTGLRL